MTRLILLTLLIVFGSLACIPSERINPRPSGTSNREQPAASRSRVQGLAGFQSLEIPNYETSDPEVGEIPSPVALDRDSLPDWVDAVWGISRTEDEEFYFPTAVRLIGEEIWVLDSGNRRIQVFDSRFKFVKVIPVENAGQLDALVQVGEQAVILDSHSQQLIYFNSDGERDMTRNLSSFGAGFKGLSSRGDAVYLLSPEEMRIAVIEPGREPRSISVPGSLAKPIMQVCGDGTIFLAERGDELDDIVALDSAGREKPFRFQLQQRFQIETVEGLSVSGEGDLLVFDFDTLVKYSASGEHLNGWEDKYIEGIIDVFESGTGMLYCLDNSWGVEVFNSYKSYVKRLGDGSPLLFNNFVFPGKVEFGPDGSLFVLDRYNRRIQKRNPSGRTLGVFQKKIPASVKSLPAGERYLQVDISDPIDIAVDSEGNIFALDRGTPAIHGFSQQGELLREWGWRGRGDIDLLAPNSITVDGLGFVYVSDSFHRRINKYDRTGRLVASWGRPTGPYGDSDTQGGQFGPGGPTSLKVDSRGFLFAHDPALQRIQVFDTSGNYITSLHGFDSAFTFGKDDHLYTMRSDRITKLEFDGVTLNKVGELANDNYEPLLPVPISDISVGAAGSVYLTSRLNNQVIRLKPLPRSESPMPVNAEAELEMQRWVGSHLDSAWRVDSPDGPYMPSFAPDGSQVCLVLKENGATRLVSRTNPRKSSGEKVLFEGAVLDYAWDEASARIAISTPRDEGCSILIYDTRDGRGEEIVQQGFSFSPVFNAESRHMAYLRHDGVTLDLFVLDLERNTEVRITEGVGNNCFPGFFGEHDELIFTTDYFSSADIVRANRHGKDQIRLSRDPGDDWGGRYNRADGKVYFLSERDNRATAPSDDDEQGLASLYSIRTDGTYLALISPEGYSVDCFAIAHDSGRVVFSIFNGSESAIMDFSPDSGSRLIAEKLAQRFTGIGVSPDGKDAVLVGTEGGARGAWHLGEGGRLSPVS